MATRYRRGSEKRQEEERDTSTALARPASTELARREGAPHKHLDDRTAEIRSSIDQARRQIAESLDDIEMTVRDSLDWRGWVEDYPLQTVGVGFAIGLYFGLR